MLGWSLQAELPSETIDLALDSLCFVLAFLTS